jgi:hypothetical protein
MVLLTALIRINELATPRLPRSASTPSLLPNLRASGLSQRHCRVRHGFGDRLTCIKESPSRSAQNERSTRAVGEKTLAVETKVGLGVALEVARLPRLLKGYGDTHDRGRENFRRILNVCRNGDHRGLAGTPAALRVAIAAALDDPEGRQLGRQASRRIRRLCPGRGAIVLAPRDGFRGAALLTFH